MNVDIKDAQQNIVKFYGRNVLQNFYFIKKARLQLTYPQNNLQLNMWFIICYACD